MFKSDFNKNRKYLLRFVTSYSILLIFILTMGLFLYQYGIADAKKSLVKQNTSMLENAVDKMDVTIRQLSTLTIQLANNSTILSLVDIDDTTDPSFYEYCLDVIDYLKNFTPTETMLPIYDYYIYLPKVDYLLSSTMLTDTRLYYKYTKGFNMEYYDSWKESLTDENTMYSLTSLRKYKNSGSTFTYLYRMPLANYSMLRNYPGIVCVEFNESSLHDIFSDVDLFGEGFLVVTDKNNEEAFRISNKNSLSIDSDELFDIVNTTPLEDGVLETSYNKKSIIITKVSSSVNGWNYYLVQPSSMAFHELMTYQKVFSVIILFTLGASFIFIYLLSKRNIKPIIQINSALETSILENNTLQQKLEDQKPLIFNSYMARLLNGLISADDEIEQITEFLHIDMKRNKYTILYASVYLDQLEFYVEDTSVLENTDLKKATYQEVLKQYFYEFFGNDIFIFDVEVNSFAIMLPCPIEETIEESINRIHQNFIELHEHLMETHSVWLYGGLGNRNSELSFIWKSYQQAIQAASVLREGHIFQSFYHLKRDKTTYYYPFEMAQQLTNFITTGNVKQVKEIFKLIRRENFETRTLSFSLIRWLLSDIRNTLLKVRFTITATDDNKEVLDKVDLAFQEQKTIDLMEEISLTLCNLYEQKADGNKLISTIQQYINENYKDSSLSLKKISEIFDISESYFSYLFKAEVKQNFSEYLEQLRMEQAMILVKSTNINISDLYLEVGYNNANSFRRAFKKVHGVSPKAIRDANSNI
ncbi:helix-turn-helix domain-containing protein [Clostridium sp. Marseille-P299]|uniref:helix-turn-helix domain-containing protein n=1 Tax=Clostridium sp. Marseille-P299 TaxID=1805477 RepID=UPI00082D8C62|nr:helix-turn-helix domain-containing protein [Clostridium sp. Marseille-P299]